MDILDITENIIDTDYGIIKNQALINSPFGLPHIFRSISEVNISKFSNYDLNGYGYSFFKKSAIRKSIGEGIERYCSALFSDYDLFEKYDFIYKNFQTDKYLGSFFNSILYKEKSLDKTKINWVKCYNIDNKISFFPSFWLNYPSDYPLLSSTNGQATSLIRNKAIEKAFFELIERHLCVKVFLSESRLVEIKQESFGPLEQRIIQNLLKSGLKITIYKVKNDWNIPCFVGLIKNIKIHQFPNRPLNYVVSKCGKRSDSIVTSLLEELIGGYYSYFEQFTLNAFNRPKNSRLFQSMEYYYSHPIKLCIEKNKIDMPKEECDYLKIIKENNLEIFFKDITCPDAKKLGLYVYKAISTSFSRIADGYIFFKGVKTYEGYYPFF